MGQADALVQAISDASAVYEAMGSAHTTITPTSLAKCGNDWFATAAVVIAAVSQADSRQRRAQRWGSMRI
jgi:hypothetical protein